MLKSLKRPPTEYQDLTGVVAGSVNYSSWKNKYDIWIFIWTGIYNYSDLEYIIFDFYILVIHSSKQKLIFLGMDKTFSNVILPENLTLPKMETISQPVLETPILLFQREELWKEALGRRPTTMKELPQLKL